MTIIQIDTLGKKLSHRCYGLGDYGYQTDFQDLIEKDSSYYLLAGLDFNNSSSNFERGTYIYKFDQKGDSIELKFLELNPTLKSIAPTKDNGFIIAGDVLIKLDSNYKEEWRFEFKKNVRITSVAQSKDGGYYGAGSIFDETINRNKVFIFKTNKYGKIEQSTNQNEILIYPNPVKDELRISHKSGEEYSISIFDIRGVFYLEFSTLDSTTVDLRNLPCGVFILTLRNKEGKIVKTHKILK